MPPRSRSTSPGPPLLPVEHLHRPAERGPSRRQLQRMRAAALILALPLLLLLAWVGRGQQQYDNQQQSSRVAASSSSGDMDHFVQVQGSRFTVNCKRFFVAGWNMWELVEAAAGGLELFGASLPPNITGPALVRHMLDHAAANQFNIMRAWAHTVTPQYALQTSPGQYNEAVFRGLDYALDEARKRGIRLLLSLTDNWQQTGGADEFVRWAGSGDHESFFTDSRAKALYKAHVAQVLGRVNTINGRRYSEDPTIFGWNLINEPRCYQCGSALQQWVQEMAAHVKVLDPNHLLTVGEEGFWHAGLPQTAANPQGSDSWANTEGQSFVADHSSPDIDFLAMHLWINNWEDKSEEFARRWIQQHIADAQAMGKPLVMEEFGVWGGDGDEQELYYRLVYDAIAENAKAGGPAQGALFWTWYAEGQKAPAEEGGSASGLFGVFESNGATWPLIRGFSDAMRGLGGTDIAGCTASRPAAAALSCGKAGYEGPTCGIDINECARQIGGCHPNAACTNTPGGFSCRCFEGYSGNGASCQPTDALAEVQGQYVTDGRALLACSEGRDVVYPEGTPGFQYDVTGALDRVKGGGQKDGYGSRSEVDPISCMLACNAAPGCDSFAFNPTQQRCFLKSGAGRQTCGAAPTVCVSARGKTYSCGVWQTYFKQGQPAAAAAGDTTTDGQTKQQQPMSAAGNGLSDGQPAAASKQLAESFSKP